MCILFIYTDPNPKPGDYRLIIASNRDEYYKRPAKPAFLCPRTQVIGGRDMEAGREGGMWLGLAIKPDKLCFGALLNLTGEQKVIGAMGRGSIVTNYLKDYNNVQDYIPTLNGTKVYTAYNLVTTELSSKETVSTCHSSNSPNKCSKFVGKQILGFGNSTTDQPLSKVQYGKQKFEEIIKTYQNNRDELVENLLKLLKYSFRHLPDSELERRSPVAFEYLSSIYVQIEQAGYGTRTHSIILVDFNWNIEFIEHTMKEPIDFKSPEWNINVIQARL